MSADKELNLFELITDISKGNFRILTDKDQMARYMKVSIINTDEGESLTLGNLIEGALKLAKRDHNIHRLMKRDIRTAGMYFLGVLSTYAKLFIEENLDSNKDIKDQRINAYVYAFKAETNEEIDFIRDNFILGQTEMYDSDSDLSEEEIADLLKDLK